MIVHAHRIACIARCPCYTFKAPFSKRVIWPVASVNGKPIEARNFSLKVKVTGREANKRTAAFRKTVFAPMASGSTTTYGHQLDCAINAVRLASKLCQVWLELRLNAFKSAWEHLDDP